MRNEDRAELGELRATTMRARGERPGGLRYWRIRDRERRTLATGWWTRDQVDLELARALMTPTTPRARSAAGGTVADVLRLWRDAEVQRHEAGDIARLTLKNHRGSVRTWLATELASVLATRLTRAAVSDQATSWRAAGVAPRTVDLHVGILRQAFRWGADRGHCPDLDLAIPSVARDDEHVYSGRVPTRAELVAVLEVVPPGPRRDGIEILGLTGARVGEVTALRVSDVDLVARTLRLSGRDPERGRRGKTRERLFPLRGRLLELVSELVQDRPPTARLLDLPRTGADTIYTELARASDGAVTPHGIRRLVVSELLLHGNAKRVSELTGHSVVTLLRYYVRPTAAELGSLVEVAQLGVEVVDNVTPIRRRE